MQPHSGQPEQQADSAQPTKAARKLRHLVLGLGALAIVSVLAGTALSLWRMHADVLQRAEHHLLGLSQILGVQIARSTHAVEAILNASVEDAQRSAQSGHIAASEALHRHLIETITGTPYVRALYLLDANGTLISNTRKFPPPPENLSGLEHFRLHRASGNREPVISPPAVGPLGEKPAIVISRRVDGAEGRFLGVVAAEVDPSYFLQWQNLQEIGPNGVVRLLRRDGALLTGHPAAIAEAMSNYRDTAYFSQGVEAGRQLIHHDGAVIHGERVSAVYPLKEYPLVLTVTTSRKFVLQSWTSGAWLFGGIAALTSVFLGLITLWLAHQLRVDEALRSSVIESEERLQAIIQSAMDAVITFDEHKRIVLFNAAAEQIFCCSSADAIGAGINRFIPGNLVAPLAGHVADPGAAGAPMRRIGQHLALSGVRAGGQEFPIDASISQVRLRGEGLTIVILRDITERKQVEAALRENEQRYRTLFSQAMDGILLLDAEGGVISVNDSFARMHGYSVDELLNMNLRQLDSPETQVLAPDRIARILAGESLRFEVEHYHKGGHVIPIDVATSAIDIDGKHYILAFHRDITDRRRAERELKRSQQELRGLSKAANEALEAERRRTARELHDELGQLLTALKMDLESLRAALPPDAPDLGQRAQAMHVMLDSTIAATRRIAADLRPLMLDDLGLAAALDWLTQNFSKQTGIATDLVIDDTVAQVPEPIASALYRITQESLTNVTKYAHATTAEIRLERDGDWVELTVRDNGRGIEQADQNKLGTFGLLGIRERVMLLSGEVTIGGEKGRGSELRARIPLAAAQERKTGEKSA
ncbi:MAG: PAS domain S-box protein [Proteobacteria bacterium]|nr:PAS domain S-box protein [Pseudomonadota bacterium]